MSAYALTDYHTEKDADRLGEIYSGSVLPESECPCCTLEIIAYRDIIRYLEIKAKTLSNNIDPKLIRNEFGSLKELDLKYDQLIKPPKKSRKKEKIIRSFNLRELEIESTNSSRKAKTLSVSQL
jgi:hypothetical protein